MSDGAYKVDGGEELVEGGTVQSFAVIKGNRVAMIIIADIPEDDPKGMEEIPDDMARCPTNEIEDALNDVRRMLD
jgi:hypothetical protein